MTVAGVIWLVTALILTGIVIAEWRRYHRRFPRWRAKKCGCAELASLYYTDADGGHSVMSFKCDLHATNWRP